jgi:hypothetical protein
MISFQVLISILTSVEIFIKEKTVYKTSIDETESSKQLLNASDYYLVIRAQVDQS